MRVPVSWLREYVDAPTDPAALEPALVRMGLEVESIEDLRATVTGPLVVGRVLEFEQLPGLKKPIRYCQVDVGEPQSRGIICGATNFAPGDLVAVALPGTVLPGDFTITARKTYGHVSDGMICSARELGLGEDHAGIMILPPDAAEPGSDARPVVGLDEVVVELAITPDRGYCLSVRGIARELSHSLGVPFRDPASLPAAPGATADRPYDVSVEDPAGCDRFAARVVRNIRPNLDSPQWMQARLVHAGMRPISLAVDITNYLMLEFGQPMHAFDLARISGPLVVRRARPGEKLVTLDGVDRALDPEDMVICDDTGPISLAAVMGGASSEVSEPTVNVLLEAAHWDAVMVARTARRHRLSSEAARRWERGVDPQLALPALQRAVDLLTEYAGGELDDRVLDINTVQPPRSIRMAVGLPARTAGMPYPPERVGALLEQVGCAVVPDGDTLSVTPPTWRPDLTDPADLAEEVVRLDGYDRIPGVLPVAPPGTGLTPYQRRRRSIGRTLAEAGYVEVLSYPFVGRPALDALGLPADDPRRQSLRLANPISDEEPALRTTLLPPLLATLRRNIGRGLRDLALFEHGAVFHPVNSAAANAVGSPVVTVAGSSPDGSVASGAPSDAAVTSAVSSAGPAAGVAAAEATDPMAERGAAERAGRRAAGPNAGPPRMGVANRPSDVELSAAEAFVPVQPWHVAVVLAGDIEPAGWWGAGRPAGWADAIEAVRLVLAAARVPGDRVEIRRGNLAPWHPGRCAEIVVDGIAVGHAGELHPSVCAAMELPRRTCAAELVLDALPLPGVAPAPVVSTFPPALIDVALLVPSATPAASVERALVDGAGELLESIRLFDVYSSEQLGEERKSLAYKLTFRAADRTLTVEEAVAARDAAVAEAAQRVGAVLRGGS